jgi:hypothetical protein
MLIVDVRSWREYMAGHVEGAAHVQGFDEAIRYFKGLRGGDRMGVVLYSGFRIERASDLADRLRNSFGSDAPLSSPELYILERDVREFFAQFPQLCFGTYRSEFECESRRPPFRSQPIVSLAGIRHPFHPPGVNPADRALDRARPSDEARE